MTEAASINVQYITDEAGEKNAVVVPIEEYHDLLQDLRDLAAVAERTMEVPTALVPAIRKLIARHEESQDSSS